MPAEPDSNPAPQSVEPTLVSEARRLYLRYAVEIVERYQLCPWAASARAAGSVHVEVIIDRPLQAASAAAIERLADNPQIDIGLLVLPTLEISPRVFEHFVASLRDAHSACHPLGAAPFALADFHPEGDLDSSRAERLVPFFRRTPDPTIQLVRQRRLHEVRMGEDQGTQLFDVRHLEALENPERPRPAPLHTRIIQANFRTLQRVGIEAITETLQDIAADRDRAYAALGVRRHGLETGDL